MSTGTMVSLDEFIVFNTPNHSCDNKHYIGSDRLKTLTYAFLIGDNKIYQRHKSYWLLKAVLVEDKLLVDYSFEDIDLLEEQILILSAFDKEVTIKWETLWEYFKLPSVAELNDISKQLTDRKIEGYHNPLKATYYTLLDDGKTVLSFEDWEVEMNTLHTKWLFCERLRLADQGYSKDTIEDYLSNRTFKEFLKKFYDDGIQFYSKEVEEDSSVTEMVVSDSVMQFTVDQYNHSIEEMRLSTGLPEELQILQITLPLSEYIDLMLRMSHSRLTTNAVIHHATVIHNHHHPISQSRQSESPFMSVFEDLTDDVMTEEEMYQDALQAISDISGLETNEFLPLSTTSLNDYLDWIRAITNFPEDGAVSYGTIVYNYHRIENEYVIVEDLADEVTEAGQIDHPF